MDDYKKNIPNWEPTPNDYRLIFKEIGGQWREITRNLPKYENVLLSDYLEEMGLNMPDGCTFCRIELDNLHLEYRDFHSFVRIDVKIDAQ